jgi:hypothetical protein
LKVANKTFFNKEIIPLNKMGVILNRYPNPYDKSESGPIQQPSPKYDIHMDEEECYVATAVYGNHPNVDKLREFRDNYLKEKTGGRILVNFYYSGAGKKAANFIEDHLRFSIPLIRRGLDFLVDRL